MRIFFAITVLTLCAKTLFAQCSDAGVCVIGAKHKSSGHYAGAGYVFGKSAKEDDLTFHTLQIEIGISVFKSSKIGVVFPWSRVNGPLGNTSGVGDLTVLWNQDILGMPGKQLNFQIGGKLATGNANSGSLPQAYQPGLGTNDLLLGISYETEPWLFSLGYQLSKGRSENTVTRLRRGDDALARVGYKTRVSKLLASLEVLAIKRLEKSSVADSTGAFVNVPQSDQFQANILATLTWPLGDSYSLRGLVAVPLLNRDVNLDGLTRSTTLSIGVQFSL